MAQEGITPGNKPVAGTVVYGDAEGAVVSATALARPLLLDLYQRMLRIRRTEEHLVKAYQRGLIPGACHTYIGEEAVAAGVCAALHDDDMVFSTHRGHGHALAKGVSPRAMIAEVFGRSTGVSAGRGGSMHLFAPEIGLMGTSGIVGPCILQACGAGYSFKLRQTAQVAVAFFGDGAANNGAFHEGLNMAGIWHLPVLFVCENNQYATEVAARYACANPDIAARGALYSMEGIALDGNDAPAVARAAQRAVARARQGGGPTLLECRTYRVRPHAEGMGDFTYRTREEVEAWKQRDPILRLRAQLLDEGVTERELTSLEEETLAEVRRAAQAAEQDPWPEAATATAHVYDEAAANNAPSIRVLDTPADAGPIAQQRQLSFMQATLEALTEEMAANPDIFVLGEGVGERGGNFGTTTGLWQKYGSVRLCDTPICERGFVGLAAGAAMSGTRPVVDFMFSDFVLDSVGEIVNQIAKMQYMSNGRLSMPVLLRGCIGVGHSSATHHSGSYYPMYAHFPGLRVVVPSTPFDAKGLLKRAMRCNDPVLFFEHKEILSVRGPVPEGAYEIEFGRAAVVRPGTDLTVVALGHVRHVAEKACTQLQKDGVSVELIDPRCVAPLDIDTILQSVHKTGRLLIVDEAFSPFGLGAEISAQVVAAGFDDLDAPIQRLHTRHTPIPYSPTLEQAVTPQLEDIVQAVRRLLEE